MANKTIQEALKPLFEEHDYYKRYKKLAIVTYTDKNGDIWFYQATRNVPRYIAITDKRWWRKLNQKQSSDTIPIDPTPVDPDPTPAEPDTLNVFVGYNPNRCTVTASYDNPEPVSVVVENGPNLPITDDKIVHAVLEIPNSDTAKVTLHCSVKEGFYFINWQMYENDSWQTAATTTDWTINAGNTKDDNKYYSVTLGIIPVDPVGAVLEWYCYDQTNDRTIDSCSEPLITNNSSKGYYAVGNEDNVSGLYHIDVTQIVDYPIYLNAITRIVHPNNYIKYNFVKWQTSSDKVTWTDIDGGTAFSLVQQITSNNDVKYYRAVYKTQEYRGTAQALAGYDNTKCSVTFEYAEPWQPIETNDVATPYDIFDSGRVAIADCPVPLEHSANVSYVCTPKEGYRFSKWQGYDNGTWVDLGYTDPTASSPIGGVGDIYRFRPVVEEIITPTTARIYVSSNDTQFGRGSVDGLSLVGDHYVASSGGTITLKAEPTDHSYYAFTKWQMSTDGGNTYTDVSGAGANYNFTIPDAGDYYFRCVFSGIVRFRVGFNEQMCSATATGHLVGVGSGSGSSNPGPFESTENIDNSYYLPVAESGYQTTTLNCVLGSNRAFIKWQVYDTTQNAWTDISTNLTQAVTLPSNTIGDIVYYRALCKMAD